ncbi:uncharacterized protein K452DRAFT_99495 [Aplosporella prunicola CBS 121167]|uniref:Uncharacterized protein n=1 Tax=Aplosporella prunicola CBS 121167 TaxID=1176127 RepID=A0A6A6B0N8_9PEZI|nr:uncharacterized protein K452DRAFT_99495 [Aplosporella prunicola CBS 121167]KAF2137590.1 hypothetical protein K452DRAFT_99495 [Aplosporella prunicola CBS 121167]
MLGRQEAAFRAFHDGGVQDKAWSSRMIRVPRRGPSARLRRCFISLRLGVCQWRASLVMAMGKWVALAVLMLTSLVSSGETREGEGVRLFRCSILLTRGSLRGLPLLTPLLRKS